MNKKPAVVAKTAPKRGRPAGSVNKKVVMTYEGSSTVDWEKLAKQLQAALASQIRDNDILEVELSRKRTLWERLVCLGTGAV
jgi:hypothetical protein